MGRPDAVVGDIVYYLMNVTKKAVTFQGLTPLYYYWARMCLLVIYPDQLVHVRGREYSLLYRTQRVRRRSPDCH